MITMITLRRFGAQTASILWKDLRCELRARQVWMAMGMFALLALVIFNFAFDLRVDNVAAVAPGALWIAFVFASILGLGRTFAAEQEHGSLDRLLLCPVDRKAIYAAKLLGNLVFIGAVELISLPVFAAIYNLPVLTGGIIPIVLLGTVGIAAIGTLFAAIAGNTRAREVLLPLLVFPLIVPVVIGAVRATQGLISPLAGDLPWLGLIAAFDVIFLSISAVTFAYVIEE
ncbi:MAG TPA: heme exporter protein CcmB [Ktedonobacterales bacterium]|jgi:heme exporter protein B|nr:heme exporter protein CcmB [Ktedonobacterales bacterium]